MTTPKARRTAVATCALGLFIPFHVNAQVTLLAVGSAQTPLDRTPIYRVSRMRLKMARPPISWAA
jgi:hypothetical protein